MDPLAPQLVLHQQHTYLSSELVRVNHVLGSLASKKTRLDRLLNEADTSLVRTKKRKMKQARFLTNKSFEKAQREQAVLRENLNATETEIRAWQEAETSRFVAQYQYNMPWVVPQTQYFPESAHNFSGTSTAAIGAAQCYEPRWFRDWNTASLELEQATTSQDFTYPQEIAQSTHDSTDSISSKADSGFEEPPMYMMPFDLPINYDASQHIYAHEIFYQPPTQVQAPTVPPPGTVVPNQIFGPPVSALPSTQEDTVSPRTNAHLQSAPVHFPSHVLDTAPQSLQEEAESHHRRRYSENAVQIIEHRLSENQNKSRHSRNKSSGQFSTRSRVSIGSSLYSPTTPMQGHRASLIEILEGRAGALNAEMDWL
ncbi:hypothetical protein EV356DRAFT_495974, partial [Viridothelium virens]